MSLVCPMVIAALAPELCRAVDNYCERTGSSLDAEPVNAVTNVALLIAAAAAWRLLSARPGLSAPVLMRGLSVLIASIGLGSFVFHTISTRWAEWVDVLPILAFMLLYLWTILTRLFAWSAARAALALAAYCSATLALEAFVPAQFLWGGALYLPTLLVLGAIGAGLRRRRPEAVATMLMASGVFLMALTARTLDMPLCGLFPLGTHFLWHLLIALWLYLMIRLLVVRSPRLHGEGRAFQ